MTCNHKSYWFSKYSVCVPVGSFANRSSISFRINRISHFTFWKMRDYFTQQHILHRESKGEPCWRSQITIQNLGIFTS